MVSSPRPSRLTPLQRDLLDAFFAREGRMFLTGGAALAGFYFGHRETEDLDLFGPANIDLEEIVRSLEDAARVCNADLQVVSRHPDFRRHLAIRGEERCVVDLVVDRVPMLEPQKVSFGAIRVDPLREIAANKISALIGRSELEDLVDLSELLDAGLDLERAREDASGQPRSRPRT
ncbi:nucleotidyl transferase AbiEii/AbiGii toxin family protein [Myxococcota bacterium]|nr:nucleotidyl transferase AbiEii/AbiGii toxin family protein [Myxococcota bacterium]